MLGKSTLDAMKYSIMTDKEALPYRLLKLIAISVLLIFASGLLLGASPYINEESYSGSVPPNAPAEENILRISLQQAIEMALKNNLDIKIESYNTGITQKQIKEAEGFFDLQSFFYTSYRKDRNKPYSFLSAQDIDIRVNSIVRGGITQNIVTGANYTIQYQHIKVETNNPFNTINPYYTPFLRFEVTQPLLKGRGMEISKRNIYIARNNHKVSNHQFKLRVMDILSNVHQLYFNLIFTIEDLKVKQGSLKLAQDQLEITSTKVEVGTLAPIEIAQVEAEVARREAEIISAESAVQAARDTLIKAITAKTDFDSWNIIIEPTDELSFEKKTYELEECLQNAMRNRPDLAQAELNISNRKLNVNFTKNQKLPQVDLQATLSLDGLDGNKNIIIGNPFTGEREVVEVIPGGLGGALGELFTANYRDWTVGVNVTIPIQNRQFEGAYARSKIQLQQEQERLQNLKQNIILEVKSAVRAIETNKKSIDATKKARELAQKQLEAEQKKFAVGTSTNFQVLQMQEDLAARQSEERRAIIDYNVSLFNLKKVLGTLLEDLNIQLES